MARKMNFKGRSFVALSDFTPEEIWHLLKRTEELKKLNKRGKNQPLLKGKTLGMIFQKSSTRTRVSFEVAMFQLGGHALFLSGSDLQLKRGETIADTSRVMSRYVDGIMARVFAHQDILDLAKYSSIPVINALSDYNHPCQGLTDIFTIYEKGRDLKKTKMAYVGDGNNMVHSLISAMTKVGGKIAVATPKGYEPNPEAVRLGKEIAQKTGGSVELLNDPVKAVKDADVIYTDTWASMGQEAEHAKRVIAFKGFQVNSALLKHAKNDVLVMHCLPAHRGEEITDEVIDGQHSIVFDQAENRLHTQKAILAEVIG